MASSGTKSPNSFGAHEPHLELHFSDSDEEQVDNELPLGGDYSSRMEEIMDDEDDEEGTSFKLDSDDDDAEEGFLYTGVDSAPSTGQNYQDRLREVLGQDELTDEDEDDGIYMEEDGPRVVVEAGDHLPVSIYLSKHPHSS